ncbi:hypothetical protein E2P86_07960 [Sphingobacterium psychroaquaticum]|uniref:hypothetical protein n=1 Tax=Sphingobacterium psychroaquaticum TaxID=561061 RepID=UPI001068E048|nr:hypothetical protein [Sphingobacterium psychroaquaticum]QBQ41091.1 hypothetical protein E2P86_07960 [Sphingobacterium psychroaquaticum]
MYEIVTNEGSINVLSNGKVARTIPKGQQTATEQAEVVQLAALGTAISFNLPVSTTVDGVASATLGELASKLSSFKRGGGGGGGATVDFVNQRAPLLGNGMFLVGSAEGNVGRRPRPSDNGLTAVSNVSVKASGSDTYEMVAFTAAATNFSLAYRGSSGTFAVSDANAVGNPVTLGQYQGITNNALTSTETNATLNAMYPSIAINSEVRSITNKIKYIKKSATQWEPIPMNVMP